MKFKIGDQVLKFTGDYKWHGTVVAAFKTWNDRERYVVAHPAYEGHVYHIYSDSNLKPIVEEVV